MKYWNKQHLVRERCWHRVQLDRVLGHWTGTTAMAKHALQNEPSKGKFWIGDEFGYIVLYFQDKADAVYIALKYA
jgi:hypothetical protein